MHYGNGIPTVGLTGVDITYPFTLPNVYFNTFFEAGLTNFSVTLGNANWAIGGTGATAALTSVTWVDTTTGSTPQTAAESGSGWLRLVTTGANGDECFVQLMGQTATMSYTTTAGQQRPIVWQYRARINTITTSNQFFGMCAAASVNGGTDPIDTQAVGFAIVIASGVVSYQYKTSATTVATTAATFQDTLVAATVTAGTTHTFTGTYDGMGTFRFFMDGRLLKQASVPTFTTAALSPVMGIDTGSAATKSVDVDYVYAGNAPIVGGTT